MKHIIAAIALVIITMSAHADPAPAQLDRTREYRMWSAEQMINHLVDRLGRMTAACDQFKMRVYMPRLSDACKQAVINAYPMLNTIREIAASGDTVQWANIMDAIRKLETDTEAPLQVMERK